MALSAIDELGISLDTVVSCEDTACPGGAWVMLGKLDGESGIVDDADGR